MSLDATHNKPGLIDQSTAAVSADAVGLPPWRDPTAVLIAMRQLVPSTEPTVVLSSLASVCAPAIADECWGTIVEAAAAHSIGIAEPRSAATSPTPAAWTMPLTGGDQLALDFHQDAWEQYPEFSGTMTWRWHDRDRPTRSDRVIARLLLDRAIELVRTQRLEAALAAERNKTSHLEVALVSNREISQAIGILMSTYKLTSQQGFDLLRMASQHAHRKLREVAAEVCQTGMLELPPV
jgi:hypothetical protein